MTLLQWERRCNPVVRNATISGLQYIADTELDFIFFRREGKVMKLFDGCRLFLFQRMLLFEQTPNIKFCGHDNWDEEVMTARKTKDFS